MNKVIDFLEKYAEWLALGIAGLFLLFMIWSYVIDPSAARVPVGDGNEVVPGDVEPAVASAVRQLESKMNAPGKPVFPVPNFADQFLASMGDNRQRGPADPIVIAGNNPRPAVPDVTQQPGPGPVQGPRIVQKLPETPAAKYVAFLAGQSFVIDPKFVLAQAQGNPNQFNNQNAQSPGIDISWVTVEFKLDIKDLAAAWKAAFPDPNKLPPAAMNTVIVRCIMEREELLSTGKWGNPKVIEPLPLAQMPAWPGANDARAQFAYWNWVNQGSNIVEVAEPLFHQILAGDPEGGWAPPSVVMARNAARAANAQQVLNQQFDPATYTGPINKLSDAQKKQYFAWKRENERELQRQRAEQAKARAAAAESQRRNSGGSRGSRRSIGEYAPLPEGVMLAQAQGGSRRSLIEEEMGISPRRPVPRRGDQPASRNPVQPVPGIDPNISLQGGIPTEPFNPIELAVQGAPTGGQPLPAGQAAPAFDLICWAHDDTVVPGKTYRYHMKVLFKNPVWTMVALVQNAADAKQFALEPQAGQNQGWSDWSQEVRVPPTTRFFFAKAQQVLANNAVVNATVDVFKREKGKWVMEQFTVAPGDSIGQPRNGVDYSTGETLVDLRRELRSDVRIITADQGGELHSTMLSASNSDPEYADLKQQWDAIRDAEAAAANGGVAPAAYNNYDPRSGGTRPNRILRD